MLKLTPEMEAEYATFWDAMNIRVVDSGKTGIELRDKTEGDPVIMFFPRSVYEYLTVCYLDLYKNDTPEFARESILQEGRDPDKTND